MMVFNIVEATDRWYDRQCAYQMTCLGLASSRLYSVLKRLHPKPICWRKGGDYTDSSGNGWQYKLQYHIGVFLGPDYRRRAYDNRFSRWEANDVPFLRRAVYGEKFGEEEKALNERYRDWKRSSSTSVYDRLHPFGKGQEWFKTAFGILYNNTELLYRRKWHRGEAWGLHRHDLFTYQRMTFCYEEKDDYFREAAGMMGL